MGLGLGLGLGSGLGLGAAVVVQTVAGAAQAMEENSPSLVTAAVVWVGADV